ncbi:hypothetical protein [Actinomadura fibrosa]|uniref:Uncharacterized protein n=1 Tax=Actinomadura fibrosa TaxID=111802 RepID=A0ABW2XUJ8_9ACTN|nr:hypothetical protein [Actinomadura fibrosa]
MFVLFFFLLAYSLVGWFIARRYYEKRHGTSLTSEEPGAVAASLVGLVWPAALFVDTLKNPSACDDALHRAARPPTIQSEFRTAPVTSGSLGAPSIEPYDKQPSARPQPRDMPAAPNPEPDTPEPRPKEQQITTESAPVSATRAKPDYAASVERWLNALETERSPQERALTEELLERVGPAPLPPKFGTPSAQFLLRFYEVRAYTKYTAEHRSRSAWLGFGEAEKASDSAGMERAHNSAEFWTSVASYVEGF